MSIDISNFYLNTPLPRNEFMKIPITLIPDEIVHKYYALHTKVDPNGFVFIKIQKGMYGLPQAGILATQLLQQRQSLHGSRPVKHRPGYWRHISNATSFVLVVDDFSVKYTIKAARRQQPPPNTPMVHDQRRLGGTLIMWYHQSPQTGTITPKPSACPCPGTSTPL